MWPRSGMPLVLVGLLMAAGASVAWFGAAAPTAALEEPGGGQIEWGPGEDLASARAAGLVGALSWHRGVPDFVLHGIDGGAVRIDSLLSLQIGFDESPVGLEVAQAHEAVHGSAGSGASDQGLTWRLWRGQAAPVDAAAGSVCAEWSSASGARGAGCGAGDWSLQVVVEGTAWDGPAQGALRLVPR